MKVRVAYHTEFGPQESIIKLSELTDFIQGLIILGIEEYKTN